MSVAGSVRSHKGCGLMLTGAGRLKTSRTLAGVGSAALLFWLRGSDRRVPQVASRSKTTLTASRRYEINPSSWRTVSVPVQVWYEVVGHVYFVYCLIIYSDLLSNIGDCHPLAPVT